MDTTDATAAKVTAANVNRSNGASTVDSTTCDSSRKSCSACIHHGNKVISTEGIIMCLLQNI